MPEDPSSDEEEFDAFAWPQTTLTCVNRRNPIHATNISDYSQIGGVSLRYSHESQAYVIDGRRRSKSEQSKNNSARNVIRSHYRWVRHDVPPQPPYNNENEKDSNITEQYIQSARREFAAEWNHTRRKKLRKFATERRTQRKLLRIYTSQKSMSYKASSTNDRQKISSDESSNSYEGSEKKMGFTWWDDAESTVKSNNSANEDDSGSKPSDESSTSTNPPPPPPPPPSQESSCDILHSSSEESCVSDESPSCISTDISGYSRPEGDAKRAVGFVRVVSTQGIIRQNQNKKGRSVTWWDDESNRDKSILLKTDMSMDENDSIPGLIESCKIGWKKYAGIFVDENFSFETNDLIDTSSLADKESKCFSREFWSDRKEQIKNSGDKVRQKVGEAIDKMKLMSINLSEYIDDVKCSPPASCTLDKEKGASIRDLPLTEVIVIRSREDGKHYVTKAREKEL